MSVEAAAKGLLTDGEFKAASWEWVQDTAAATGKWGDIGDWDVSGVTDFSYAFSINRNEVGGTYVENGNPKAVEMNADLSAWKVAKVTSLAHTFNGASKFVGTGLDSWITASVTTLDHTFSGASTFVGTGLSKWITTSVTTLQNTFNNAQEMNSDLSSWKVGKVTTMESTFTGTSKFVGTGLASWDTSSVTTLHTTFTDAKEMNSDLSAWKVGKVETLAYTFKGASTFVGTGLDSWITTAVAILDFTFTDAKAMNSDLSSWKVGKVKTLAATFYGASKFVGTGLSKWDTAFVTTLYRTFNGASKFAGAGLASWDISKVTNMALTFNTATSLTSCNKRRIVDAWASSTVFVATSYDTDWASFTCPPQTDAQFKRASWDWVQDATTATHKWGDIKGWDTSTITTTAFAFSTFRDEDGTYQSTETNAKAATFNSDISMWDTSRVSNLEGTFLGASAFNSNLARWSTVNLENVKRMFESTSAFTGVGVASFNVGKVSGANFMDGFKDAPAITSCNKKRIDEAWKSNVLFKASDFGWAGDR